MIFSRIDRVVPLVLVTALLFCCVPALAVPAAAADTEMYFYNGVELPDINSVWTDKVTYPYACIGKYTSGSASVLILTSKPIYAKALEGTTQISLYYSTGSDLIIYTCHNGISWSFVSSNTDTYDGEIALTNVAVLEKAWSSYDLLYADGRTYLTASVPVPVNPLSSITSVSILSPDIVQAGLSIVASVDVVGTGEFDSSATLTLSGNASSGTYLKKAAYGNNWTLYCGSDETASTLTLTAASVQDPSVTASTLVTVEPDIVDPDDPDDPDNPTDPSVPTTPEETMPGNSGSLTDKSDEISDGLGDIHDFEQSQKDVLDNNMDFILGTFAFDDFIPALAFVGGYINKAFVSMAPIQLIYFVPLVIGLFFFICSRAPGATRWKPRRPPPDPTKKK